MRFNQREYLRESMQTFKTNVPGIEILIDRDSLVAAIFTGKKSKADCRYSFKSEFRMLTFIDETINSHAKRLEQKEIKKQQDKELAKVNRAKVKIGDIFHTSWGYENTYVEFFQVVEKPSQATVIVRQINKITVSEEFMSSRVKSRPNSFISEPKKCQIDKYGNITKADEYGHKAYSGSKDDTHYTSWGY